MSKHVYMMSSKHNRRLTNYSGIIITSHHIEDNYVDNSITYLKIHDAYGISIDETESYSYWSNHITFRKFRRRRV